MPSLLPRRAPSDLAAVVVTWAPVFLPGNGVDALTEVHEATPGFAARYGLRGCAPTWERSSGNLVLPVTRHTSLKLPGRAARSRGRTSTGEFQSIHGMLPDT